jgi:hypothetical protein
MTTQRRKGTTSAKAKAKNGFERSMKGVEDIVDGISHHLWELTR